MAREVLWPTGTSLVSPRPLFGPRGKIFGLWPLPRGLAARKTLASNPEDSNATRNNFTQSYTLERVV